tara:strand:- start:1183 stop:2892 length:1710 start_codon:yes stop_codon:yes gene_type:complete
MSYKLEVKYFNSFVLRKLVPSTEEFTDSQGQWPGLPWEPSFVTSTGVVKTYPNFPWGDYSSIAATKTNWYVEEARIKGGFNNSIMELGVRAYSVNREHEQSDRSSSLIYSGIFNNRTSVNNTNVFSVSEAIIKDADPKYGSIQKLFAEDTNLLIFQENKVHNALINKSTVYSGEQGAEELMGMPKVIGQLVPFLGEYGISRNPESFAIYGYRKYFTDKDRSAILRLSRDGITEISAYGMRDYFRDQLSTLSDISKRRVINKTSTIAAGSTSTLTLPNVTDIEIGAQVEEVDTTPITIPTGSVVIDIPSSITVTISPAYTVTANLASFNFVTYKRDKAYGGYDSYHKNYTLSLQTSSRFVSTADDSFDTLSFDENIKGWTSFYSYKPIFINSLKNNFYSFIDDKIYQHYVDDVTLTNRCKFYSNPVPDDAFVEIIFNPSPSIKKNFNTVAYEGNNGWEVVSIKSGKQGFDDDGVSDYYQDSSSEIKSYDEGAYIENGVTFRAGFDRKENRYVANIVNASPARPGEIIFGSSMSGVKGYFTTVKFQIDETTNTGGAKELFSVSSSYVMSSY